MHEFLAQQVQSHPELAEHYAQLGEYHDRKLWHQLAVALDDFVSLPIFNTGKDLVELYNHFIKGFQTKLNRLKLVHIAVRVAGQMEGAAEALAFYEELKDIVKDDHEGKLLVDLQVAVVKLRQEEFEEVKESLSTLGDAVAGQFGLDARVHAVYHKLACSFYKAQGPAARYYKHAMLFCAYTPLELIPEAEKTEIAFDLAIAALVGDKTYNFGELLQHPIVQSLSAAGHGWVRDMLAAFNAGDVAAYNSLTQSCSDKLNAQPALVANAQKLREKIALMALLDIVWKHSESTRTIPFADIAARAEVAVNEVEFLLMRALSLGLVKGVIDQVAGTIRITWVQARVLDGAQIKALAGRLDKWSQNVHKALTTMETEVPELLSA